MKEPNGETHCYYTVATTAAHRKATTKHACSKHVPIKQVSSVAAKQTFAHSTCLVHSDAAVHAKAVDRKRYSVAASCQRHRNLRPHLLLARMMHHTKGIASSVVFS